MKIKIIKKMNPFCWYAKHIGKVYEVDNEEYKKHSGALYFIKRRGYVHLEDAVVIEELETKDLKEKMKIISIIFIFLLTIVGISCFFRED